MAMGYFSRGKEKRREDGAFPSNDVHKGGPELIHSPLLLTLVLCK